MNSEARAIARANYYQKNKEKINSSQAIKNAKLKYNEKNIDKRREWDSLSHRRKYESGGPEYRELIKQRTYNSKFDAIYCVRFLFNEILKGRPRKYN